MRAIVVRLILGLIQGLDRWKLARLARRHPGLEIHPTASSNLAMARFELGPGARVRIEAGVTTERRRDGVRFCVGEGSELVIGEGTWLRSELQPVHLAVFDGARMNLGRGVFLNGCHLSAKESVDVGTFAMVGPGSRVFDADQHPIDAERPERRSRVEIGDYAWVAADVTVTRGVRIGAHSIVGARSVVTDDIPDHRVAVGSPARPGGRVGDRSVHPF